jgi:AraC-like DNA-binding protein
MFTYVYTISDYNKMLQDLSELLHVKTKDNWLFFPLDVAEGYYRVLKLSNGLDVNIINCKMNVDWLVHRINEKNEYYTLRFDHITVPSDLKIGIGGEVVEHNQQTIAVAYLTSSLFDWYYHGTKGTTFKGVNILIPKEWLGKLLGVDVFEEILTTYIALKSRSFNMEPLDKTYYDLMNEIMQEDVDHPFPNIYIQNRVQLLLERFFTHIHNRVSLADVKSNIRKDDIYAAIKIEQLLVENFSVKPKSIEELSKKATMSSTKLKKIFKTVFGVSIYEYYQQKRMMCASELIAMHKYSMKEVAEKIGYSNMHNFATAFKKHMKQDPFQFSNN